jgi:hypothetical protein
LFANEVREEGLCAAEIARRKGRVAASRQIGVKPEGPFKADHYRY